jgi:hypothetical protein
MNLPILMSIFFILGRYKKPVQFQGPASTFRNILAFVSEELLSLRQCLEVKKILLLTLGNLLFHLLFMGARDSVVGWSTMVQAGRTRVRIPIGWIF